MSLPRITRGELRSLVASLAPSVAGAKVALWGGAAALAYGSPRPIESIDLLAERRIHPPILFHARLPTDRWRVLEAAALAGAIEVADIDLPVVTPETLAALLLARSRPHDRVDLRWLLAEPRGLVDVHLAEVIVREHLGEPGLAALAAARA